MIDLAAKVNGDLTIDTISVISSTLSPGGTTVLGTFFKLSGTQTNVIIQNIEFTTVTASY